MKSEVLKGPRSGAFISYGIGDSRQTEALFNFNHHEKNLYYCHRHKAGANPIAPYSLGASLP
jgi:hypothetical protein